MEWLNGRNIEQFNGTRYGTWKFRIKSLLEELQVLFVIEEPPPEHPDAVWATKNSVAKCTIVNFLDDAFLHLAEGSATAKSIIDSLDKLYEKRCLGTQVALRKNLFNLKLQPNASLLQHFTTFDTLIAKLTRAGVNLDEMDKICHLLMTLPFSYKDTIASLEFLHEDHFDLAFIKTVLLDHEAKMEIDAIRKLKESTSQVPTNKRPANTSINGPNKRRKPNNYYQNTNFHRQPYSQMYCDYCGRRNHYIQNCRFYNKQMNGGYNWHPNHSRRAPYNGYQGHDFPLMFPQFAPKGKRQFKKTYNNYPPAPSINLTIKQEPVSIKQEPIEIKEEPIRIKQEPAWEEHLRRVVKKEPEDQPTNVGDTTNGSNTSSSKRSRERRRTRASIIAMHIQADNAAQVRGN